MQFIALTHLRPPLATNRREPHCFSPALNSAQGLPFMSCQHGLLPVELGMLFQERLGEKIFAAGISGARA